MNAKVHVFEQAGLGKAPFTFLGSEKCVYVACPGAPAQPGSSCDYCGQAITYVFNIAGADGSRFKVGCECVKKTGDAGLKKVVAEAERARKSKERRDKNQAKVDAGYAWFETVRTLAETLPHPKGWEGHTLASYVDWYKKNAGYTGMLESLAVARRMIES